MSIAEPARLALIVAAGATACGEYSNVTTTDQHRETNASLRLALEVCEQEGDDDPLAGLTGIVAGEAVAPEKACPRAERRTIYEVQREGFGRVADSIIYEEGSLSPEDRERLARPWLYADRADALVEGFWGGTDESGRIVRGHRVELIDAPPAARALPQPSRHEITIDLTKVLAAAVSEKPVNIVIRVHTTLRHTPLPRIPDRGDDLDAYNRALEARAAASAVRKVAFESEAEPIVKAVESSGGTVRGFNASVRAIYASVPPSAVPALAALAKVDRVSAEHHLVGGADIAIGYDDDGSTPGNLDNNHIGQVAFDYTGENGSQSPIEVAVTEAWGLEDEACMFDDDSATGDACDPTERLKRKYKCSASDCNSVGDYTDTDELGEDGHGTIVTSVLAASYTQGQTNPNTTGEPPLDADWRQLATGIAREVTVDYAQVGTGSGLAHAYGCLGGDTGEDGECREVDVVNSSLGFSDAPEFCSLTSSYDYEDALETLWDDDVLPVVCAHNQGSGSACRVINPADIPMAFTVGGLDGDDAPGYDDWGMYSGSPRGGANGTFGSTNKTGTISVIDLVADADADYHTTRQPGYPGGTILPTSGWAGTSFAAPLVAGAAALLTEYRIDTGDTWINDAGFIEAHLLAMGDRYSTGNGAPSCVLGGYSICGFDQRSGLGRLKLQAPTNWQWTAYKLTFNSIASSATYEFSLPIPDNSAMVKCVMTQREPMAHKANLSLVALVMTIRDKVGGQCVVNSGSSNWTIGEGYWDTKHHVTILDSQVNIENRCADIDIDPAILSSDGSVTTYTYCYTSPQLE